VTFSSAMNLYVSLIVLVNPPLVVPLFLNLTARYTSTQRRAVALTAGATVAAIFLIAAFFGEDILAALSITVDALRAAGGIILALIAIDMLWPPPVAAATASGPSTDQSPAIVPIAFPMLAGPGSIALVIAAAADNAGWDAEAAITVVILAITLTALTALLLAGPIKRLLGDGGLTVLSRLMAMLLLGIGLQMLVVGLGNLLPGLTA
jgi:multiple antibiotic resistance protein